MVISNLELLASTPWLLNSSVLMLGLLIGSFLNVVAYRLPIMLQREWRANAEYVLNLENQTPSVAAEPTITTDTVPFHNPISNELEHPSNLERTFNLMWPGSQCPQCGQKILAWQNIPVLSFLLLKGRCFQCKTPISKRYPLVEAITGLLSLVVVMQLGWSFLTLAALVFTWSLWALTLIDYDHQLLPDSITLPLLWLGLLINTQGLLVPLNYAVWGAVGGYLSLWSVYWVFKLITGKEGMGYGDFKLLAALGAWMGWQALPTIILLSSFVGAVVGITLIFLQGRSKNQPIPFGPYLAAAGWLYLLWGQELNIHHWLMP
jgi:leader peptidase (prepilin peptidase)/N-methyltransferase